MEQDGRRHGGGHPVAGRDERENARRDRSPARRGAVLAALGIGVALCGLAVQGALSVDGSAALEIPRIFRGWLAEGGIRISADAELSDPRLLFAGCGATLLLLGAAQIFRGRSESGEGR